jgi:hypothetical protein
MAHHYRARQLAHRVLAFVLVTLLFCTAIFAAMFWISP